MEKLRLQTYERLRITTLMEMDGVCNYFKKYICFDQFVYKNMNLHLKNSNVCVLLNMHHIFNTFQHSFQHSSNKCITPWGGLIYYIHLSLIETCTIIFNKILIQ